MIMIKIKLLNIARMCPVIVTPTMMSLKVTMPSKMIIQQSNNFFIIYHNKNKHIFLVFMYYIIFFHLVIFFNFFDHHFFFFCMFFSFFLCVYPINTFVGLPPISINYYSTSILAIICSDVFVIIYLYISSV